MVSKMELRESCTPPTVPLNCSSTPSCGHYRSDHYMYDVNHQMTWLQCLQYLCDAQVGNPEPKACGCNGNEEHQDGRSI